MTPYLKKPLQVQSVSDLTNRVLKALGIQVLVLDFDGVLSPHGDACPGPVQHRWLKKLSTEFEGSIFILSNKPFAERQAWMATALPDLPMITGVRKKPYPDGLLTILQQTHASPEQLLMVDDRLLTGILAAVTAGVQARFLTQPPRRLTGLHALQEYFFSLLRVLDRIWITAIGLFSKMC